MKTFRVELWGSMCQTVEIEAESEAEARREAMSEIDWFECQGGWIESEVFEIDEKGVVVKNTPDPNQLNLSKK